VFVFPSLYEGFGIPILEALAVGVPIVASRGTSLEEVGGESGIYADPQDIADIADKIKSLLKSSSFREQKINMGWERSKEFSWEKTVRETWKALLS
jgi:glycosyltransferase involved in cell wall biosynthesis